MTDCDTARFNKKYINRKEISRRTKYFVIVVCVLIVSLLGTLSSDVYKTAHNPNLARTKTFHLLIHGEPNQ